MIEQMRGLGYRTVVVYPATRTAALLQRLRERAAESGRIPKPDEGVLQTVEAALAHPNPHPHPHSPSPSPSPSP